MLLDQVCTTFTARQGKSVLSKASVESADEPLSMAVSVASPLRDYSVFVEDPKPQVVRPQATITTNEAFNILVLSMSQKAQHCL